MGLINFGFCLSSIAKSISGFEKLHFDFEKLKWFLIITIGKQIREKNVDENRMRDILLFSIATGI